MCLSFFTQLKKYCILFSGRSLKDRFIFRLMTTCASDSGSALLLLVSLCVLTKCGNRLTSVSFLHLSINHDSMCIPRWVLYIHRCVSVLECVCLGGLECGDGGGGGISRECGWGKDNDSCISKRITWVPPNIMYLPLWDYGCHFHLLHSKLQCRAKALRIPPHSDTGSKLREETRLIGKV